LKLYHRNKKHPYNEVRVLFIHGTTIHLTLFGTERWPGRLDMDDCSVFTGGAHRFSPTTGSLNCTEPATSLQSSKYQFKNIIQFSPCEVKNGKE